MVGDSRVSTPSLYHTNESVNYCIKSYEKDIEDIMKAATSVLGPDLSTAARGRASTCQNAGVPMASLRTALAREPCI